MKLYSNMYVTSYMSKIVIKEIVIRKIYDHRAYTLTVMIKILFFFFNDIRMNGKNINFDDKKSKKVNFTGTKSIWDR